MVIARLSTRILKASPRRPQGLRRGLLAALLVLPFAMATPAAALDAEGAKEHVAGTVSEMLSLVRGPGSAESKADALRALLEKRAAMPQIARFSAGRLWKQMDAGQQSAFTDAFAHYLSTIYARRFQEYSGQEVVIRTTKEARRGIEVASTVEGGGETPINVVWLISDRPGRTVVADIVIEGVSLLITQREEIAAIYSQQGRDADKLIAYLAGV